VSMLTVPATHRPRAAGRATAGRVPLRLAVTGGGTGGHVYPALAVIEAGLSAGRQADVLWIGWREGLERSLVERAGLAFVGIEAGRLRGAGWRAGLRHTWRLARGFGQARGLLARFRPHVVLATGGFVTFPVALAARWLRVPVLVYLPDIEPGLAVRLMAPLAAKVAVTAEPAQGHFRRGKAVVTGFPVRTSLAAGRPSREQARARFGIPADERVVLIFGGSQGAHSLNAAVGHALEELLAEAHVLHIHGRWDREWLRARRQELPAGVRERYHLFDYLHEEMAHALVAADVVVARAGASTLGEFPAVGLPAILVPYPHSGAHQWANARYLASHGAAVIVPDDEIRDALLPRVRHLLHDQARLTAMRRAMRALARPGAALAIYELLEALAADKAVNRTRSA